MQEYQPHPAAELFPSLPPEELDGLVASMRDGGYKPDCPIILFEGKILDGRHRYAAAKQAGVEPTFKVLPLGINPYRESWERNGVRRHLEKKDGQRACIALECDELASDHDAQMAAANEARQAALQAANEKRNQEAVERARLAQANKINGLQAAVSAPVRTPPVVTARNPSVPVVPAPPPPQHTASRVAEAARVSPRTVESLQRVRREAPALYEQIKAGTLSAKAAEGQLKQAAVRARVEDVSRIEAAAATGVYDVIVLDPPWAMEKVEREVRPNQGAELDYPTMSEAELAALKIPVNPEGCHVWVWTTHRFLPMAFRLLDAWRMTYSSTFVWHKPGGFQVVGLPQYNCEFALYARVGSPKFLDTKAFNTCFQAPRGAHSAKPEVFYETLRRVTGGRRLDMFNRRQIDGFDRWGNEAGAQK